jgi:hypothetical protein
MRAWHCFCLRFPGCIGSRCGSLLEDFYPLEITRALVAARNRSAFVNPGIAPPPRRHALPVFSLPRLRPPSLKHCFVPSRRDESCLFQPTLRDSIVLLIVIPSQPRILHYPFPLDGCPMFASASRGTTWVEEDGAKPLPLFSFRSKPKKPEGRCPHERAEGQIAFSMTSASMVPP